MPTHRIRLTALVTAVLAALLLTLTPAPSGAVTDRVDAHRPGQDDRRAERALAALARVEARIDSGGELTMALRDLALLRQHLPAAERRRAASYLLRPTDRPASCTDASCYRTRSVRRACTAALCVHWVSRSRDRLNGVPGADRDRDRRPDYVERVLATTSLVHRTYVRAGYRPPRRDGRRGGNAKTDIYLAQLGDQGIYGYCTSDDRRIPAHARASAYCVLDNDYARREFPRRTPLQNMRVTAAHEYFHAVQFGYDIGEDGWFMEGTATWAEDEVLDRIDDNRSYLRFGPLGRPAVSLDLFERSGLNQYGVWIFFRNASERFGGQTGRMPSIVRRMWELADARRSPQLYSAQAVDAALAERGSSLARQFVEMAYENRIPGRAYEEGDHYRASPLAGSWTLTAAAPTASRTVLLDHLTSATFRFVPGAGRSRLTIGLALPDASRGSVAVVRVFRADGTIQTLRPTLVAGGASVPVDFAPTRVKQVEVTVANASARYSCWQGGWVSCRGAPLDDNLEHRVTARAS